MPQALHTPVFKMGDAVSVWTKHPLPRLMGATATWHALEIVISVVEGHGPWTSTRTPPTTPQTSLILDASRTPSMILTGCSLRGPITTSGTTHQIGKLTPYKNIVNV